MIVLNWRGNQAGPIGWIVSVVVAVIVFGADSLLLLVALGRSLLLSLFVLYIIWMALLLYQVVSQAGAIDVIGRELPGLAHEKAAQALLLGWVFTSFLQGASGFGVPAAVVAPLLAGLGFSPVSAVVIALVGHAWAVTFGSLGSSFYSMIAATGLAGKVFAAPSAALLGICCLLCGLAVLWESGGFGAIKSQWGRLIGVGIIMSMVQFGLAIAGLWSLAAFGAALVGLAVMVLDFRLGIFDAKAWKARILRVWYQLASSSSPGKRGSSDPEMQGLPGEEITPIEGQTRVEFDSRSLAVALFPYLLLTIIIIIGQLILKEPLSIITINPIFPEVITSFGWQTAAGPGRAINLLGHAGALLLYTSILSYFWFRSRGTFDEDSDYRFSKIAGKTARSSVNSTLGIMTLVAMAVTMQHAGMTQLLAQALSLGTGPIFPLLSPFIGALGAFMTGSNTNSNVVFGQLQLETAVTLGLSVALILASQTTGGAIGSLFAPAKVLVGASTVEGASDGQVLKRATKNGLLILAILGIVIFILSLITA
jgi:lactate permease